MEITNHLLHRPKASRPIPWPGVHCAGIHMCVGPGVPPSERCRCFCSERSGSLIRNNFSRSHDDNDDVHMYVVLTARIYKYDDDDDDGGVHNEDDNTDDDHGDDEYDASFDD